MLKTSQERLCLVLCKTRIMNFIKRNLIQSLPLLVLLLIAVVNVSCGQTQASTDNESIVIEEQDANDDLYFNVSTRWNQGKITKDELNEVKSFFDLVPQKNEVRKDFRNIRVIIMDTDWDFGPHEVGQSLDFNEAQLGLLQNVDYSRELLITAMAEQLNPETNVFEEDTILRYMSVVPEVEAQYKGGIDAVVSYLKESSKEQTALMEKDKLQPAKFYFTVGTNGEIINVHQTWTSGYDSVDKDMMEIIRNMPRLWTPAQNSSGENVEQEFVFFFGVQGC